ncbi:HlyD family secretion protein [Thalassotalea sp. PS06]|uniref:HlyD family secretion protein n=1 Tax=Thalassotalea sp. PS06 TaxID=2594005 RepID=UPI0011652342|nr:HlyD family efflux transporter periplasmic adaptor subunit [Thalassotalea sp. PS06]QDP01089.1 HlyD family efflux transporter periplasmic adaptor subunit [Thalassotalea sp. PS06]
MGLFRKEVLASQNQRLQGAVLLAQPFSINLVIISVVLIFTLLISFLATASYSRKETVRGYLKPDKGIVKTYGQSHGYIKRLHVREGEQVTKGQALVTLASRGQFGLDDEDYSKVHSESVNEQLKQQITIQLQLLTDEIAQHQSLKDKEIMNVTTRLGVAKSEYQTSVRQSELLERKVYMLKSRFEKMKGLLKQGFVSDREIENHSQQLLDLQLEQQMLQRGKLQQRREIERLDYALQVIPEQNQLKINTLERQKSELMNRLNQSISNHQHTITANRNGVVTGIQVIEGETINPSTLLFSLLPEDTLLNAELFLPTKSVGFIGKGQLTKLRFDAFPYQKFGVVEGQIVEIHQTIIEPAELSGPFAIQEPVYRIKGNLNRQYIASKGKHLPLRSGMLFQADIVLEERSILAWLFEPLIAATKKL